MLLNLQAKVKDVDEAQQKSFERIKQLYKKEDASKFFIYCVLILRPTEVISLLNLFDFVSYTATCC